MKNLRSLISLSFQQGTKTNSIKSQTKHEQNIQFMLYTLSEQIGQVKKQLKNKVSRSEFVSSLSSKLSISELASLNLIGCGNKQNISPNLNSQRVLTSMNLQIQQLKNQINLKKNQEQKVQYKSLQELTNKINKDIEQFKQQIQEFKVYSKLTKYQVDKLRQQICQKQNLEKHRLTQIQAYMYKKADRSQIDKLFTLNQLLVIEIQQAKQKGENARRLCKAKDEQILREYKLQWEKYESEKMNDYANLKSQLKSQISILSNQIDRIVDLLELKETKTQQNEQVSTAIINNCNAQLQQLNQIIKNVQLNISLQIKQVTTRLNILQIKQNHMGKTKQMQNLKNQIQVLKCDVRTLYEKSSHVSVNIKQFCQSVVRQNTKNIEQSINQQISSVCQQIMKKVLVITEDTLTKHQFEVLLNPLKDKMKNITLLQTQNSKKIDLLQSKQQSSQQYLQEQIQKNQQRFSVLQQNIEQKVHQKYLSQTLEQFVSIQQMKEITKQVSKKLQGQIRKIVQDQDKINSVLCSQNIIGKWYWTNTLLKCGNLIVWDKQIVNTYPQNFKWNKNEPQLIIEESGYYRIQMGFYSKKKPTVQLIINGQTIVSAVNSNSYVIHHSSGKLKDVSNAEIGGLTYVDFLMIHQKSRIAISYIGQFTGEGFLAIQRM